MEVEVLMKRMVELQQQQEEEECTQEEMVTRFERERSESIPTGRDEDGRKPVPLWLPYSERHIMIRLNSYVNTCRGQVCLHLCWVLCSVCVSTSSSQSPPWWLCISVPLSPILHSDLGWHLFTHHNLFILFVLSGGAGSSAWRCAASGGGSRVQIRGLRPQRRAVTAHHESPGRVQHMIRFLTHIPSNTFILFTVCNAWNACSVS